MPLYNFDCLAETENNIFTEMENNIFTDLNHRILNMDSGEYVKTAVENSALLPVSRSFDDHLTWSTNRPDCGYNYIQPQEYHNQYIEPQEHNREQYHLPNANWQADNFQKTQQQCLVASEQVPNQLLQTKFEDKKENMGENYATANYGQNIYKIEQEKISLLPTTPPILFCYECVKYFSSPCYLQQHNNMIHGNLPCICKRCGKKFADLEKLTVHEAQHTNPEKRFKCTKCRCQYNYKADLNRHSYIHTNNWPHRCDVCDKGFARKNHMQKHRNTHFKKK